MSPEDCYDRIRCSLSDEGGPPRFTSFEIVGMPECRGMEWLLQEYLVGRPLADLDVAFLRGLTCEGSAECMHAVVRLVHEYQDLFLHDSPPQETPC